MHFTPNCLMKNKIRTNKTKIIDIGHLFSWNLFKSFGFVLASFIDMTIQIQQTQRKNDQFYSICSIIDF